MLTAETVVAGAATVDVAALGAVECAVKVPHYIVVTPVEQSWSGQTLSQMTQSFSSYLKRLGFFFGLETWPEILDASHYD